MFSFLKKNDEWLDYGRFLHPATTGSHPYTLDESQAHQAYDYDK